MTNLEIIATNMVLLIHNDIITEDDTINTFIGWKMKGYSIKKGEKHIAEFPIWVKNKPKKKAEEDSEDNDEAAKPEKKRRDFIFQTAYWFTDKQVEPIRKGGSGK